MSITSSGLFIDTWSKTFTNAIPMNLTGDTFRVALFMNDASWSPNYSQTSPVPGYGQTPFVSYATSANHEVSTVESGYTAGGKLLESPTLTEAPAGTIKFSGNNVSWTSSSIQNAFGALIYDDTLSDNNAVAFISFGAAHSTLNGTFTIQWSSSGIITFSLV